MNIHSGNKKALEIEQEIPVSEHDPDNENDELFPLESAGSPDDENINLDDDNENPVSHTLVDAAENSGTGHFRETRELEGEEQESKEDGRSTPISRG